MALWRDWPRRQAEIERVFNALMDDARDIQGDLFAYAVAELGSKADNLFSVDCLLQGLFCADTSAKDSFKQSLYNARLHMRLCATIAAVLGR